VLVENSRLNYINFLLIAVIRSINVAMVIRDR